MHLFNQNIASTQKGSDKDEQMQDESHLIGSNLQKSIISTEYQSNPSISPQSQAPLSDFLSSNSNSANRPLEEIKMNFTSVM